MARMSVYLPDDMAEALKRHREAINVSQVLRDALTPQLASLGEVAKEMREARDRAFSAISEPQLPQITEAMEKLGQTIKAISDAGRWFEETAKLLRSPVTLGITPIDTTGLQEAMRRAAETMASASTFTAPRMAHDRLLDFTDLPRPYDATEDVAQLREEVAELREELRVLHQRGEGAD